MKEAKKHLPISKRLLALSLSTVGIVALLSTCEKSTVDVNLHGVNYTGETFTYVVSDPKRPDSGSGGELIDPFGAGGMTCCVTLPKVWRPGIMLKVHATHWLKERPDGSLPEIKEEYTVEVPRYVDGKPGEMWVLRTADGKVSVISSDFQPNHPKWPGQVKGWPVPSLEYRRERWELMKRHEEGGVRLYLSLLNQLAEDPRKEAKEAWEHAKEHDRESLKGFSGPEDPAYVAALQSEYNEGLNRSRKLLQNVMEMRP